MKRRKDSMIYHRIRNRDLSPRFYRAECYEIVIRSYVSYLTFYVGRALSQRRCDDIKLPTARGSLERAGDGPAASIRDRPRLEHHRERPPNRVGRRFGRILNFCIDEIKLNGAGRLKARSRIIKAGGGQPLAARPNYIAINISRVYIIFS